MECDTVIQMEPTGSRLLKGQPDIHESGAESFISKQINRGSGKCGAVSVEYHKRIASSFASFILPQSDSLSSRKRKGGMGQEHTSA